MTTISTEEQQKYWAIFSGLNPTNGFLSGQAAGEVLAKSGLPDDKLADVWDRSDIDNDGMLDFEEFCVAMRLIFDLMNGVYINVPPVLPDFLIPGSKQHLITANTALENGIGMERPDFENDDDGQQGLKDGFDWYMSPSDKSSYDSIYSANADRRGGIKFDRLTELYTTLDVPEREIESAWTLVNPKLSEAIGKDQTLVFLHILNQRHQKFRIPRNVPASLRATFQKSEISYNTSKYSKDGTPRTAEKKEFGGTYLSKLGVRTKPEVDNSKDIKDGDWELIRLQRELTDLNEKLQAPKETTNAPIIRRELEQLLAFKKGELATLDKGEDLQSVKDDIAMFEEQVTQLQQHLKNRQQFLEGIK